MAERQGHWAFRNPAATDGTYETPVPTADCSKHLSCCENNHFERPAPSGLLFGVGGLPRRGDCSPTLPC